MCMCVCVYAVWGVDGVGVSCRIDLVVMLACEAHEQSVACTGGADDHRDALYVAVAWGTRVLSLWWHPREGRRPS